MHIISITFIVIYLRKSEKLKYFTFKEKFHFAESDRIIIYLSKEIYRTAFLCKCPFLRPPDIARPYEKC